MSAATNSKVIVTLAARRKLEILNAEAATGDNPRSTDALVEEVKTRLGQVFDKVGCVLVHDVYSSYRVRPDEYILLVEQASGQTNDGLEVVKIGPPERLDKEFQGWLSCRPPGLRHDLVLMNLETRVDDQHQTIALVYADAEQFLGVDVTSTLEAAVLNSIRLGVPTLESVGQTLFSLYERLGLLLYKVAYTEEPKSMSTLDRLERRLDDNLTAAQSASGKDVVSLVTSAVADADKCKQSFFDPVAFAKMLRGDAGDYPGIGNLSSSTDLRREYLPRLRRGRSHGDLHGRNVLVGQVGDRILWPTVYDYGDMGPDNVIGYDFVKMETEIKVRAYAYVYPLAGQQFVTQVLALETTLHELTEKCRNSRRWPKDVEDMAEHRSPPSTDTTNSSEENRLLWTMLAIREQAERHLGAYCFRTREWLAEYYFLLALYGLNGLRFDNQTLLERVAGYVSAGAAASRYLDSWTRTMASPRPSNATSAVSPVAEIIATSRQKTLPVEEAIERLRVAFEQRPDESALADELARQLLDAKRLDEAEQFLDECKRRLVHLSGELIARFGRVKKDRAVRALEGNDPNQARSLCQLAEGHYRDAFDQLGTHYPRVNELSTRLLRASLPGTTLNDVTAILDSITNDAATLLADNAAWKPTKEDDDIWIPASRGEAHLLAREWALAEKCYGQAVAATETAAAKPNFDYRGIMAKQIETMILPAFGRLGIAVECGLANPDTFFAESHPTNVNSESERQSYDKP